MNPGAALARARDAHVMQQSWAAICRFRPVDETLAQKVARALSALDAGEKEPPPLFPLAVDLIRARDAVLENWRLEAADRLYRKRLDRFRRQTRNEWVAAEETSQPEHYHSARKAAKNWMYALRVTRTDWGGRTKRLHRDLKAFTEALGNANDCAVLEQWLGHQDGLGETERMAALEAVLSYRGHWLAQARSVCPIDDD
jgi:CHAD domain-containing protein